MPAKKIITHQEEHFVYLVLHVHLEFTKLAPMIQMQFAYQIPIGAIKLEKNVKLILIVVIYRALMAHAFEMKIFCGGCGKIEPLLFVIVYIIQ